jgi:hypothetical protein
VTWWVNVLPEVPQGIKSFGFSDPVSENILQSLEHYLSLYGERCAEDRWDRCPEKFFVYSHVLAHGGRLHTLVFIVDESSKAVGVLNVVWVENHPGDLL